MIRESLSQTADRAETPGQFRAGKPQLSGLKRPLLFWGRSDPLTKVRASPAMESRCSRAQRRRMNQKPGVTSPCSSAKPVRWVSASVASSSLGDLGPMPVRSVNA